MNLQSNIDEWEVIQEEQRMERYFDTIELLEAQEDME